MRSIVILLFIVSVLMADDKFNLAFIQGISKNGEAYLRVNNTIFECKTYGVLSLNELSNRKEFSSSCERELILYFKKHPQDLYFPYRHLHIEQKYHYEFIGKGCLLYSSGQVTYSEVLLKKGLAVMLPLFKHDIWKYRHQMLQDFAKQEKKGIWENNIISECIAELYEE